jgi:hypothetical protein
MKWPANTVLVVVGEGTDTVLRALDRMPNVRAMSLRNEAEDAVDDLVAGAPQSYVLHDVDPLAHVAHAWVEFFDDQVTLDTLDVEVAAATAALLQERIALPDYYVVLDSPDMPPTWRHWWLGVLAARAPQRVLPTPGTPSAVGQLLRRLPAGRPWPDPQAWLRTLRTTIPDQARPLSP